MQRTAQRTGVEPGEVLRRYYRVLLRQLGPQGWWPARTRLEIILGAILVQNTNWRNAALAIARLREAGLIEDRRISDASLAQLEALIRPAGYFRQKARTLQSFAHWLQSIYHGRLDDLFAQPGSTVRTQLLALRGLGPETVDAILLYAGNKPFFVADAYSRRILSRHGLIPARDGYAEAQGFLHRHLPADPALMGEFHALLVETGKRYCRRQAPQCESCPLGTHLTASQRRKLMQHLGTSKPHRIRAIVLAGEDSTNYASR